MSKEREGLGFVIAPYLMGQDATNIEEIQQRLRELSYIGQRQWWIEPAFYDIIGKIKNKPVCELLGGKPCDIPVYCSLGEVYTPEKAVEIVENRIKEGFKSIKLRVHYDYDTDISQVKAVCNKFKDKIKIGVDANQGWFVNMIEDVEKWD